MLGRGLDCRGWPVLWGNSDSMRGNTGLDRSLVWTNMRFLFLCLLSLQSKVHTITIQKEQAHCCINCGTKCFLFFLSLAMPLQLHWFQLSLISWHLSGTGSPAAYNLLDQVCCQFISCVSPHTAEELRDPGVLPSLESFCAERQLRFSPRKSYPRIYLDSWQGI